MCVHVMSLHHIAQHNVRLLHNVIYPHTHTTGYSHRSLFIIPPSLFDIALRFTSCRDHALGFTYSHNGGLFSNGWHFRRIALPLQAETQPADGSLSRRGDTGVRDADMKIFADKQSNKRWTVWKLKHFDKASKARAKSGNETEAAGSPSSRYEAGEEGGLHIEFSEGPTKCKRIHIYIYIYIYYVEKESYWLY